MSERVAADLPDYFPSDLELRLQDSSTFELMHQMGEANNYLFALGHKTLRLTAEPSVDNDLLTSALLAGVEAYEVLAATVVTDSYSGDTERPVVVASLYDFIGDIKKPEDFYAKVDYAKERLEADPPRQSRRTVRTPWSCCHAGNAYLRRSPYRSLALPYPFAKMLCLTHTFK